MIEIIPNWHPIFVHFAIALLAIAVIFHIVAAINSKSTNYYQFENVANWNLWLGALFAIITAIAGWFASNSVDHDTPSHLAMLDHRNWAIGTTILFIVLAFWSFRRARKAVAISWLITLPLIVAAALLGATGWKGGELVYRYGLGVMSLPKTDDHDHGAHDHGEGSHDMATDEHGHDHAAEGEVMQMQKSGEAAPEVGEQPHSHDNGDQHHHDEPKAETAEKAEPPKSDGHDHDHGDHPH